MPFDPWLLAGWTGQHGESLADQRTAVLHSPCYRRMEVATVRLDIKTETALKRLSVRRGQTQSEVIRDAIVRLAEEEGEQPLSAFQRLQPFIGIADSGGQQLSERTGQRFRELLERRKRARGTD